MTTDLAITRPQPLAVWERQPGESEPAHAAFLLYRDMERGARSAAKVGLECGKNRRLMERWSAQHSWLQRVAAWDESAHLLEDEKRIEQIRTTNAAIHDAATEVRNKTVAALTAKDFDAMSVAELIALFETVNKADRQALGMDSPGVNRPGVAAPNGSGAPLHFKIYSGFDPSEI